LTLRPGEVVLVRIDFHVPPVQLPAYTLPAGGKTVTIQIAAPSTGQSVSYEMDSN
jgi:hypothetical protein